ncbi:putative taurine catabolism dioxygenase protein [Phaeoacremonium minimum UCRPA7]|uniref:Putative taurine catabolism dioxygenase protein n=1 Tax=Phaeoacremonium minimum (strain UCR-PA7) TaxID=1286976 RepID=R8BAB8_PHAM7|nr:putative taurine catabolism dioxygenase protein [Phaeoacremonium minimum UCRPA7]EON96217.1 putative taurine catabolism dioxygenase protein [Phaeoacremonium minimum UCRPA7]
MAPGALIEESTGVSPARVKNADAPRSIFPDGIRTSGQHPPLYDALRPYEDFPKEITGPTLWKREDYINNPERWTHPFTDDEVQELSAAADNFIASGTPLTGISQDNFPLPKLSKVLNTLREDLLNGKGFILFKRFPADVWGPEKNAVAYMGLGTYIGYFVSQNGRGHVLGHVKDVGDDATQIDRVRIYRTTARQFFHADDCDIVGLLCVHRAAEGGESDIVSIHNVWNSLQRDHPDVAKLLTQPVWYFDRKGETSVGEEEWIRQPIFYIENGGKGRVYCKWDPYFVRSLTRFSDKGLVPPLSQEQKHAITVLEDTCNKLALHMVLEVGDIQFVSNTHLLHARTAYKDYPPPAPRRHLLRLWLSTPETEGGWVLPFHDSTEKKRGGIQVNDNPPRAPLDAE